MFRSHSNDESTSLRLLRRWQWVFNLGLLAVGLALVWGGSRRAFFFVAFVPVAFAPFSYARILAHRLLTRDLGARSDRPALAVGIALDVIMAAQLVTGRMPEEASFLHGDTISWIGPVWYSAHALLFFGSIIAASLRALGRLARRAMHAIEAALGEGHPKGGRAVSGANESPRSLALTAPFSKGGNLIAVEASRFEEGSRREAVALDNAPFAADRPATASLERASFAKADRDEGAPLEDTRLGKAERPEAAPLEDTPFVKGGRREAAGGFLAARLADSLRFRRRNPTATARPDGAPVSLERREALKQLGILGVGAPFALSLSGVPLSYDFRVEERELKLPNWPRELDGLRVVHLSDIHVGGAMNRERLRRVAELAQGAKPDIVLHTGDFLTHRVGEFDRPLYEALATIEAPYGQWASLGNHDFDEADHLVRRLRDAGVVTLRDRTASLLLQGQPLEIAGLDFAFRREGLDDYYADRTQAWEPREGAPRILLNHDPRTFYALPEGIADLVCSGHTHGGHIGLQLGRDHALTVVGLAGIPDQGIFERSDMRMFVTRCVGFYGYPMRLGIPPEISVLVLRTVASG